MSDLLFNVLSAVIMLVVGAVVRYLVPWLKAKLDGTKLEEVMTWAYKFVQAAEQTIIGGASKKDYVTEKLKELLVAKNISLSSDQVDALIEGIVNELYPKEG